MTSNTRVPEAEITGVYGAMVKRFSKKMFGDVPESVEVAWHNKPVLKFTFGIGQKTRKWHECDENLKSFAHMAVADRLHLVPGLRLLHGAQRSRAAAPQDREQPVERKVRPLKNLSWCAAREARSTPSRALAASSITPAMSRTRASRIRRSSGNTTHANGPAAVPARRAGRSP